MRVCLFVLLFQLNMYIEKKVMVTTPVLCVPKLEILKTFNFFIHKLNWNKSKNVSMENFVFSINCWQKWRKKVEMKNLPISSSWIGNPFSYLLRFNSFFITHLTSIQISFYRRKFIHYISLLLSYLNFYDFRYWEHNAISW